MAGFSAQGTTFTFAGNTFFATNIKVSLGGDQGGGQRTRVACPCLHDDPDLPEPFMWIWQPDPMGSGAISSKGTGQPEKPLKQISLTYLGSALPAQGTKGALSIAGPVTFYSSTATVMSSSVTLSVGDLVRGEATFVAT